MMVKTASGLLYAPSGLSASAQVTGAAVAAIMRRTGCNDAQARAVLAVESAGEGMTTHEGKRVPKILLESHKVYIHTGALPISREAPHLSTRNWTRRNYNRLGRRRRPGEDMQHARWGELVALGRRLEHEGDSRGRMYPNAERICRAAGILGSSWGLGQVLGSHWDSLGYESLQAFLNAQYASEDAQADTMARFIRMAGLADDLRRGGRRPSSWRAFARGYNGRSYASHNYHGRLAAAYKRAGGR